MYVVSELSNYGEAPVSFIFFLLTVTFAASDVLHESCNRTRFPAFCVKSLHFWSNPNQHSLALYSFHRSIVTGNATVFYANIYMDHRRRNGLPKTVEENRLFDCLTECAYALNRSVSTVEQARAFLDVDRKKTTTLLRWAASDVVGAGCVKQGGPVLAWIDKNDRKYKKLLRITLDLISLLKK
uniref:Pectinesterase inhibitor domain-containing protein n=1 Tax=Ananas comosus var. bracteatus TaxID=296719 RepID=A0A6V7NED3_ANACO|nr:unnamed protein product [Ananas comosus var. bracteatus]